MRKLFTIVTLALLSIGSAWAQTSGTETVSNTGTTDTEYSGTSITIDGKYIAGIGGSSLPILGHKGIKLRTNKTTATYSEVTYNTIVIDVKDTYTITSFTLKGNANSTTAVTVAGIYADENTTNLLATTVTLPTKSADSYATASVATMSATSKITIAFETTTQQINVDLEFDWEKAAETRCATPTFDPSDDEFTTSSLEVSIACDTDGASIYYTLDGSTPTSLSTLYSAGSKPTITGTTTIKAIALKDGLTESDVASKTYTKVDAIDVFDASAYNATFVLTKENLTAPANAFITNATNDWQTGKTYAGYTGDFYNMSKTDRSLTMTISGATCFEVYVQNTNADRPYKVKVGDSDALVITHKGTGVESSGIIATGTTGTVTIVLSGSGGSVYPVYIKFNPTTTITPSYDLTTLTSTYNLDFANATPAGLTAYIATGKDETSVTLLSVDDAAAGTGLVLKGTASTEYTVPLLATATDHSATNKMAGSATETTSIDANAGYILSRTDGKFHPANAGTLPAGKAYLNVAVSGAPVLDIDFGNGDGISTAIDSIKANDTQNGEAYNLNGQRAAQPTKGLYIVNGKKVIIK